jgi:KDO2-lipid IV(A) lauroyltransferase
MTEDGAGTLALDGSFWRRMAQWGSQKGPWWFKRYSPPVIGLVICALMPERRRAIAENLRKVRGPRGAVRETAEVARTFATYAACLSEVLGGLTKESGALVRGELHIEDALSFGRGVILVTAHTAGWEATGVLLARDKSVDVMIVETPEADAGARAIQDQARRISGVKVVHVGDDPLSALPLVRHLRANGAVAMQVDRVPEGVRGRTVTLFGSAALVPEGPLRLAALTGAPIVPVFVARASYRRYEVFCSPPVRVDRHAAAADLDVAAQELAGRLEAFVRERPTQWFHFRDR